MYEDLVKQLKICADETIEGCDGCKYIGGYNGTYCMNGLITEAASAIDELDTLLDGVSSDNDALCETIERLKKPRWIPVSERLPEDLQTVLVVRKDGGIYCWMYSACSPTDEVWVDEYANAFSVYDTTHWMPLPEPPKEET